ncbi:MAG TPA: discoidin domain-containing protein [Longimicrobiales bacterium]|nr:discoidin domain-containing protein [Longimicrobiales bacterium]
MMVKTASVGLVLLPLLAWGCASAGAGTGTSAQDERAADTRVLDDFETIEAWQPAPASGVRLDLSQDAGRQGGSALRIDFDFQGSGGWAALRRDLPVRLPENYELSFWLRADAPDNTLEFKLIDESGDNVWWVNRPRFQFAGDWRRVSFRRRHVTFAWGPAGGGEIRDVAAIELAITAGPGGAGTVWIDDFTLTPLDPVLPYDLTPSVTASTTARGTSPDAVLDADSASAWRSGRGGDQELRLDFGRMRECGGILVHWVDDQRAYDYDVETSADGRSWQTVRRVRSGGGARDALLLPETESRFLRLRMTRGADASGYAIRSLDVQPIEWGTSRNNLFESVAAAASPGLYPRYFLREQMYWTIVGVDGDQKEALISEDGAVEPDVGSFSLEPFLFHDERLLGWADARSIEQSLEDDALPIPSVRRDHGDLVLTTTSWADGEPGASTLWVRYRVQNTTAAPQSTRLFVALRPFQVNPTWQFLNNPGGSAVVRTIEMSDEDVVINDEHLVVPVTPPDSFGAATFDAGGALHWMRNGTVPPDRAITDGRTPNPASFTPAALTALDGFAAASAALQYDLRLQPGAAEDIYIAVPFHTVGELRGGEQASVLPSPRPPRLSDEQTGARGAQQAAEAGEQSLARTTERWREKLAGYDITLPSDAPQLGNLLKSIHAYVLINRDGPAIQPGSRSYQRSWIRDGSMTSAALLRLGDEDVVREFAEWYAPYQYDDGKVPCCVDQSGAGAVPENDSHGQLIYLVAEYHRFTGDDAFLARMLPHVEAAVAYMDSLRHSRMTPVYETADSAVFYGLMPQSISHEGYSAKPMHSYWDDFFALKGFRDAVYVAEQLGRNELAARWAQFRDAFERDLVASLERAMEIHDIDYLPGAAELGDFDATSTTVGITPAGATDVLPQRALYRTFDRYWSNFQARATGAEPWDAYTPYELRTVGTFVRLGQRERAQQALAWFMEHIRPRGWNHWAEVVTSDAREPRFLGDMPHGWVGSDFIRSATDIFVYHDEASDELVFGAGVLPDWLASGPVEVRGLHTPFGVVGYRMERRGDTVTIDFEGSSLATPPGGFVVRSPLDRPVRSLTTDGMAREASGTEIVLESLPRRLVLHY